MDWKILWLLPLVSTTHLYLKNDGTVINKGSYTCGSVSNWTDVVAISARESVAAGLKADSTILLSGAISSFGTTWNQWTNMVQVAVNNDAFRPKLTES